MSIAKGIPVRYDGDPLNDFTQMRFLDRFVFRNPKTKGTDNAKVYRRKVYDPHGIRKLPVTSKEYAEKNRNEIPIDERFLHRFASVKMNMKKERKGEVAHDIYGGDDDGSDVESVDSDEFDLLLSRFEGGGRMEVSDVEFAKEFSSEKKKNRTGRKRPFNSDTEEDEEDGNTPDQDEEREDWSEDAIDEEEERDDDDEDIDDEDGDDDNSEGSEDDFDVRRDKNGDSSDGNSDEDFAGRLDFVEDAERSADKFAAALEEEGDESTKKKKKSKKKRYQHFKNRRKH
ncbi:unnamed protein product [Gongylonema pulchrum]|uniref:NUC153 domain-containing protein n=1 Tax=Gongylonema pulchrum TaxID=637853 RepID=A0A183EML6_9BILA|nr:unnamed protein product [Gongylonema pulchrum]